MNLSAMMVVARKELTDGFRDRRAIYTLLFSTLFGPLLISFMFSQFAGQKKAAEEIRLPVVGRERAPVLVNWLAQQSGVEIVPGPSDPEAAVRDRKADIVLAIKSDFAGNFSESKSAPVQVFSDSTRTSAEPKVRRLKSLLGRFSAETGSLRLIVRGVSPEVANPLKLEEVDVANSQQRAAMLLNVLLMFLAMAVLTGAMQIATDSTAGERERGSLEPLLLNPVPRWQLIGGKWLAAVFGAFLGMVATLLVTVLVMSRLSLEELGVRLHLGKPELLLLVAAMAPLALIAPAIQVYLSCFAKSFKEAQSYTALLVAGSVIPGVISTFYPMSNRPWMQAIPVLAQYSFGTDILGGKAPSPFGLIAAAIEGAILAGVFLWLAARLFSNEKIIFGR
jgi:sodium transport system permease protein